MKDRSFILNWPVRWMVLSTVDQTYTSSWNPGFEPRLVHVMFVLEKCLLVLAYLPVLLVPRVLLISRTLQLCIHLLSVCLSVPTPRMPSILQRTVLTDVTMSGVFRRHVSQYIYILLLVSYRVSNTLRTKHVYVTVSTIIVWRQACVPAPAFLNHI